MTKIGRMFNEEKIAYAKEYVKEYMKLRDEKFIEQMAQAGFPPEK